VVSRGLLEGSVINWGAVLIRRREDCIHRENGGGLNRRETSGPEKEKKGEGAIVRGRGGNPKLGEGGRL